MNCTLRTAVCGITVTFALALLPAGAQANVFLGTSNGAPLSGTPKAAPGTDVELSIVAGKGTTFDALDISPDYGAFDQVLTLLSFHPTAAYTSGGSGLCSTDGCAFSFLPNKSFAADTVLATLRFKVQDTALPSVIDFDLGVNVGSAEVPLPESQKFEVLGTIPEPSTWLLMLAGFAAVAAGRCRTRPVPA
jgi:PEP-CTERM motif